MKAVLQYVLRTLMKDKTGIVQTMPKKEMVDFNVAMTTERLMRNGFDPNAFKNADQVENAIKQIEAPRVDVISQGDPRFEGIMNKLIGKKGEVFDMQGNKIDPRSKIMGGKQSETEAEIAERLGRENKEAAKRFKDKMKDDPEDMAQGGRAGFKDGMSRRKFMQIMGGLAALPIVGKFFKAGKVAAPAVEAAKETVTQAPSYFFDLVNKIKMFGKQSKVGPQERVNEFTYTGKDGSDYVMTEDIVTGDIRITKDKLGGANYGDMSYDTIEDRTEMVFRRGQMDETTKGKKTPDEYDEYKVEFDQDGTAADATDIDEISKMEIIKEVSDEAPSIKKAGGGIARMLGE